MHGSDLDKVVMGLADVAVAHRRQSPGTEDGIACWVARFSFGACAAAVDTYNGVSRLSTGSLIRGPAEAATD